MASQSMAGAPLAARWTASRPALWLAFAAVHGWLAFVGVVLLRAYAFSDVDLYRYWVALGTHNGFWPVLSSPWVYPVGALVPMLVPAGLVGTDSTTAYMFTWCALVTALDAVAVWALVRRGGTGAAWWWLAFLLLLGPVAMGRIDAIVAPVVIVALLLAARRPQLAVTLLTVGAWIKVAPGALLLPLVMIARRPLRDVVLPGALVSLWVVAAVVAGGGRRNVASFLFAQGARGLQIESVTASPWAVASLVRDDVAIVLNKKLSTWEAIGPGTLGAARLLDVLLPLALGGVALLLWRARSRPLDVLVWGPLAIALVLIVVNKVGSPQFIGWLGPPVAVALAVRSALTRGDAVGVPGGVMRDGVLGDGVPGDGVPGDGVLGDGLERDGSRSRSALASVPGVGALVLVIAGLTQIVFPLAYMSLLTGSAVVTAVLVLRNALLLGLLVGVCVILARGRANGAASS
ncbi:MAG TPA: hypothetical protein VIM26_14965 [Pengzhenrongella sp.]